MTVQSLTVGELAVNTYLVWESPTEALLIDPGDEPERLLAWIRSLGLRLKAVLLTHAHFDHMGAVEAICRATGAPLWVGAADEAALTDDTRNLSAVFGAPLGFSIKADRLLHDGDTVSLGGTKLTVYETPGHTPGSLCLLGGGALFSGDTLFSGSCGRTDFPGGDYSAMRASLRRLADLPGDPTVYPGHGETSTLTEEKRSNPVLSF